VAETPYHFLWGIEPLVLLASAVAALAYLHRWFLRTGHRLWAAAPNPGLGAVRLAVLAGLGWILLVLATQSSSDIVGRYDLFYAVFATGCLMLAAFWRPMLGLWARADVAERGNLAAGLAIAGFVLGTAFAYGGALTGEDASCLPPRDRHPTCLALREEDPGSTYGYGGWHVVLAFFLLAYAELRGAMAIVRRYGGGIDEAVRLDRDPSAGLLLGAVAVAAGLVAGRAAAGDFLGWRDGLADYFRRLWPLAVLPALGALLGRVSLLDPAPQRTRALGSASLVGLAALYYVLT
jgi:uncharacterized membrane protein YjfL (UPF0719 family)